MYYVFVYVCVCVCVRVCTVLGPARDSDSPTHSDSIPSQVCPVPWANGEWSSNMVQVQGGLRQRGWGCRCAAMRSLQSQQQHVLHEEQQPELNGVQPERAVSTAACVPDAGTQGIWQCSSAVGWLENGARRALWRDAVVIHEAAALVAGVRVLPVEGAHAARPRPPAGTCRYCRSVGGRILPCKARVAAPPATPVIAPP